VLARAGPKLQLSRPAGAYSCTLPHQLGLHLLRDDVYYKKLLFVTLRLNRPRAIFSAVLRDKLQRYRQPATATTLDYSRALEIHIPIVKYTQRTSCSFFNMGLSYNVYLNSSKIYGCKNCKTHLSNHDDIISRVSQLAPRTA
jgi:hypothetical protein